MNCNEKPANSYIQVNPTPSYKNVTVGLSFKNKTENFRLAFIAGTEKCDVLLGKTSGGSITSSTR